MVPAGERALSQGDAGAESIQPCSFSQMIYCLRLLREANSGEDPWQWPNSKLCLEYFKQHRIYGLRGSSSSSQWQMRNTSLEKLSK